MIWPPVLLINWILWIILGILVAAIFYVIVIRLFAFGIFKSYFDARRDHYKKLNKKLKEEMKKDGRA